MDEESNNYHDGLKELREREYKLFEESTKSEREICEDIIRKLDIQYNENYNRFCKIRDDKIAEALTSERNTIEHAEEMRKSKITPEIKELYDADIKAYNSAKQRMWMIFEEIMYPNIVTERKLLKLQLQQFKEREEIFIDANKFVDMVEEIFETMYPMLKETRTLFEDAFDNHLKVKSDNKKIIFDAETEYNNIIKQSKIDFQNAIDTAKNVFRMIINPIQLDYDLAKKLANEQYNKSIADKRKIYENTLIKAQEEYELSRQPKAETNEFGML